MGACPGVRVQEWIHMLIACYQIVGFVTTRSCVRHVQCQGTTINKPAYISTSIMSMGCRVGTSSSLDAHLRVQNCNASACVLQDPKRGDQTPS